MLDVRLREYSGAPDAFALPVYQSRVVDTGLDLPAQLLEVAGLFLDGRERSGEAGAVQTLPRPGQRPGLVWLVGIGDGDERGWRKAGAALARAARKELSLTVALESGAAPAAVRGLAEGLALAAYRYRPAGAPAESAPRLRRATIATAHPDRYAGILTRAAVTAEMTCLARDLANAPSAEKSPAWLADRVVRAAAGARMRTRVRTPAELATGGFGGILAVGAGSSRGPRLVELGWTPRHGGVRPPHVVLVGKGITFDSGGLCIKTREGMKLMRKDMSGAATVAAVTIGAARMRLGVRVTALLPLAENMVSGTAYRPGDVVRHYGGLTDEIRNTDAEGRVVLADALAYAAHRLAPDALVDVATLTGAARVALGTRTAALFSDSDELAGQLRDAATAAGELVWRMPLPADYAELLTSDIADVNNAPAPGQAGSVSAALFLREFAGSARDRWAHLDMSAPSWADGADGELVKRATGWGVRTLLRWLESLDS